MDDLTPTHLAQELAKFVDVARKHQSSASDARAPVTGGIPVGLVAV